MSVTVDDKNPIMKVKIDEDGKHAIILDINKHITLYNDPRDLINRQIGHIVVDGIEGVKFRADGKCIMFYYNCHCIAEDNGIICNNQIIFSRATLQIHQRKNNLSCGCIEYKKYEDDIKGNSYDGMKVLKFDHWEFNKSRLLNQGRRERVYYYKCRCKKHGLEYILSRNYLFRNHKFCKCILDTYPTVTESFKNSFRAMHERCYNKNNDAYMNYGGRGIKICERWYKDIYFFKMDKYASYWEKVKECGGDEFKVSIDRTDVNGDYTPENTKWSTDAEQNRNRRNTVYYYFNGVKYNFHELLQFCDQTLLESTFRERLYRGNMCVNNIILSADIFKDFRYRNEQISRGKRFPINYTTNINEFDRSKMPTSFNYMTKDEACKKD